MIAKEMYAPSPEETPSLSDKQANLDNSDDLDKTFQPTRQDSVLMHRTSANGLIKGPMAYFGRFKSSLLMTRSIGDKFGPRGCLPLADITAVTVGSHEHTRFVLASDGECMFVCCC